MTMRRSAPLTNKALLRPAILAGFSLLFAGIGTSAQGQINPQAATPSPATMPTVPPITMANIEVGPLVYQTPSDISNFATIFSKGDRLMISEESTAIYGDPQHLLWSGPLGTGRHFRLVMSPNKTTLLDEKGRTIWSKTFGIPAMILNIGKDGMDTLTDAAGHVLWTGAEQPNNDHGTSGETTTAGDMITGHVNAAGFVYSVTTNGASLATASGGTPLWSGARPTNMGFKIHWDDDNVDSVWGIDAPVRSGSHVTLLDLTAESGTMTIEGPRHALLGSRPIHIGRVTSTDAGDDANSMQFSSFTFRTVPDPMPAPWSHGSLFVTYKDAQGAVIATETMTYDPVGMQVDNRDRQSLIRRITTHLLDSKGRNIGGMDGTYPVPPWTTP